MEYTQELLSLLNSLELQRTAELKKFGVIALIVLLINLLFFIKFRSNFLISLALGFILLVGSYYIINTSYTKSVQTILMPKIIKSIDGDFEYLKETSLTIDTINSWKLFSHVLDESYSSATVASKDVSFSFMMLESATIDTEEGRHETQRFDGVIVYLDTKDQFDQKYLLSAKKVETPTLEVGDYINAVHMGLKPVKDLSEDLVLFSQNGESSLSSELLKKLQDFKSAVKKDIVVVCDKNRVYILVDGINEGYNISIFKDLKTQGIVQGYAMLIGDVKKLTTSTL